MNKIIINPHNCSLEKITELKAYLNKMCWDWKEVSTQKTMTDEKHKTIIILGHKIEYWFYNDHLFDGGIILNDSDIDHIKNKVYEDYIEGELCSYVGNTYEYGWWKIII